MSILLGYHTALNHWRSLANVSDSTFYQDILGSKTQRRKATNHLKSQLSLECSRKDSLNYLLDNPESHIITLDQQISSRRKLSGAHKLKYLPDYSCMSTKCHFGKAQVFASTPEFSFLQMASVLPLEKLILLGYELCSTYAVQKESTLFNTRPLTSPQRIKRFLVHVKGLKGLTAARRAVRYIVPNSASPMESSLTMLLTLPYSLGGFGIPFPKLNYKINLPASISETMQTRYYVCDLYWENTRLAIEYDSNYAHAGINKTAHDALRRSALTSLGISVLSVTWPQVKNLHALNQLAHLVAKRTGKRLQYVDPEFTERHMALRNSLLFDK